MATDRASKAATRRRIVVIKDGPYLVQGDIPLVIKKQVASEHGEPLTWQKEGTIAVSEGDYCLCRCGQSSDWPFCDGTHEKVAFDGTESADTGLTEERTWRLPHGTRIVVSKDPSLCMQSGFCGMRHTAIDGLMLSSKDTKVRSLVMAMVERCPSGALTYRIQEDGPDIEPDLPQQIALTVETTSDGPISGPLWVTGSIPIERCDGQPFETRNRVTLCNCGHSRNKPLCDGTHRDMAWRTRRRQTSGS